MLAVAGPFPRACAQPTRPARKRLQERFLRGPISWPWLLVAMDQPGKALHVAMCLWFASGLKRGDTSITFSTHGTGLDRHSAYRGLKALEDAGLVSVVRHQGRKARVKLLPVPVIPPTVTTGVVDLAESPVQHDMTPEGLVEGGRQRS
jgi:DNA-binding transcriptional ArsR family regulator